MSGPVSAPANWTEARGTENMSPEISERSFEAAIGCALLAGGPDGSVGAPVLARVRARRLLRGMKGA